MPADLSRQATVYHSRQINGTAKARELHWLYSLARQTSPGQVWVEIGSGRGRTTYTVAAAMHEDATLICTDDFASYWARSAVASVVAAHKRVYEATLREIGRSRPFLNVEAHQVTSSALAAGIPDRSVDVVFLAGGKDLTVTNADVSLWRRKLKNNGVICGDGYGTITHIYSALKTAMAGYQVFRMQDEDSWQALVCRDGVDAQYDDPYDV